MSAASQDPMERHPDWEVVVGVEVHLQLRTRTKAFCSCEVTFGAPPNTHVCPVCLGLPGALPVLNERALEYAIRVAGALHCGVHQNSKSDRKNYFYPDLPKGYQISQFDLPFGHDGWLDLPPHSESAGKRVRIKRVHLEEDAGKLIHDSTPEWTLVDLNRAGTPLVEIVTEPDLRSPNEVYDYLRELHLTMSYLGVSDCDMEKGSFRCEPNVSVRRRGSEKLGTKTEVKNLNSFRHARDALIFEIERQIEVLESGGEVLQETRLWDPERGATAAMRSKEEAHDYRYFPDPDLPPVSMTDAATKKILASLPEPLEQKRARYEDEIGLPAANARVLIEDPDLFAYYEEAIATGTDAKALSNWVIGDVQRECNDRGVSPADLSVRPEALAELVGIVAKGTVSVTAGRSVLTAMIETGDSPAAIIESQNLAQVSSEDDLLPVIDAAIAANERAVADIRAGNDKAIGALVGFVMKQTKGKANPSVVNKLLRERIAGEG